VWSSPMRYEVTIKMLVPPAGQGVEPPGDPRENFVCFPADPVSTLVLLRVLEPCFSLPLAIYRLSVCFPRDSLPLHTSSILLLSFVLLCLQRALAAFITRLSVIASLASIKTSALSPLSLSFGGSRSSCERERG